AEDFPKVTVTRQMVQDGSRYFGPYTSVWAVHQTLDLLRRIFPYLTCDRVITGKDERACLYYDIKLCSAPCIGAIDRQRYRQMIADLCRFLEGHTEEIVNRLKGEMERAAENLQFEQAALLRDQIRAIENVVEKQKVISSEMTDSDVIALARDNGEACVQIFFIRGGKLIGREYFLLEGAEETPDAQVMAEFLKHFYDRAATIPDQVLLPHEVEEAQIIRQWLSQKKASQKVEISVPRAGVQQELLRMAAENAAQTLAALKAQWELDTHRQEQALAELQEALGIEKPLNRIECYDISNIQGVSAVGSMVVFEKGAPRKSLYRRFNIRSVEGPDDFASLEETLERRFRRWQAAQKSAATPGQKVDAAFAVLPDLLIVDGGKGQLSRVVKVLERFGLDERVKAISLAKPQEEVFLPSRSESLLLPRNSQGFYLLQRIRDEAHRFAITAHRKLRTQRGLVSLLEQIPGIGPVRRKRLLQHFGSLEAIRNASVEELTAVEGITPQLALQIKAGLDELGEP
ncbi:MAG: excinuclease ABC subunit UvrC, partial [Anaerolineales bacterium]|nr:excinuclease ABC subunit UvrC [Anaerolineales bacterium]MDW8448241.1 excinuclease ABC subunit UvrC [Anaerolineales bacterium]